mmetsp:Transcript_8728/g.24621  ORF Transcript_8728/g.24621 Transcript_8728/m.24621 type:complete len:402 (+) Transcript_8728:75-1280(+)
MQPAQPFQGQAPFAVGADLRARPPPHMAYGATPQNSQPASPQGAAGPQVRQAQTYAATSSSPLLQPRPVYTGSTMPQARRGVAPTQRMVPTTSPGRIQQGPTVPVGAVPMEEPVPLAKVVPLNKNMFLAMGMILLAMLCFLPIWDSIDMLRNINYAFWGQRGLPVTVIIVSCLIVVFFFFTTEAFFGRWKNELHTTQSLVVMASLFVTLLGLVLVLVSLPLSQKAIETHNDIVYQCGNTQATRRVKDFYTTLLHLRQTPACKNKYTIEECAGYSEEKPYTAYLKAMENNFRCSGFCYNPPGSSASTLQVNATDAAGSNATMEAVRFGLTATASSLAGGAVSRYPPTLFSNANFEASCDGAAARNLMNFARDTGYQMWYMGIVLIALSICMGLWEWSAYGGK